ncbi:MAG: glycogen debranching protein GlgX [Alphaproteobacteria bacterium]|nr:glycogen debranching protein GlgX [Alphaproteobacteria bacterium]
MKIKLSQGKPYPLGATFDGKGVNFSLFSANAKKVILCLFDQSGIEELKQIEITQNDHNIWHVYLEGIKAGQVYGYRVDGEYKPLEGKRFNKNKLLIDPYAKKLIGKLIWHKAIFGYDIDSPAQDLSFSTLDSAPYVPKSVVADDDYNWEDDILPDYDFSKSIIYEVHVKGYTELYPKIEDAFRGKFKALTSPKIMQYLKWLGITAVELQPVHAFFGHKIGKEQVNYWGYESLSFFAPDNAYLHQGRIDDFKDMVKTMHKNGIEVILDVVYNHTGEGNQLGPTLCYRGIDNESYYTLDKNNKRYYYDSTGCGASFNVENPYVLMLVTDSMRYWVQKMHVDGFRLDLAASLSRVKTVFKYDSCFLNAVRQDEILRNVKMIAEPWDASMGGYQIGAFPAGWAEWNDRFRDVVRRFWRGDERQIGEFASRIAGSSDVFGYNNKNLWSSINFITAHDGFNLNDLVSYNHKHNFANGENNRDGSDNNWSFNSGVEGFSCDEDVIQNRYLRAKALMATLLLSFGTPMILAGDELLHTQFGNNNPYCQDNIISWIVWEAIGTNERNFARYVHKLIALRKSFNVFSRKHFFTGEKVEKTDYRDLAWYNEKGTEFVGADWNNGKAKSISYLAYSENKLLLTIFNAENEAKKWKLPNIKKTKNWNLVLDSSACFDKNTQLKSSKTIMIPAWSVLAIEINI